MKSPTVRIHRGYLSGGSRCSLIRISIDVRALQVGATTWSTEGEEMWGNVRV